MKDKLKTRFLDNRMGRRTLHIALWAFAGCVTEAELARALDQDADGYQTFEVGGLDCDDGDPRVHPDADEVCGDGVDNNCDGVVDDAGIGEVIWYKDDDGDGFGGDVKRSRCPLAPPAGWTLAPGDCDDQDKEKGPGAVEVCDGDDNDCDGGVDEGC